MAMNRRQFFGGAAAPFAGAAQALPNASIDVQKAYEEWEEARLALDSQPYRQWGHAWVNPYSFKGKDIANPTTTAQLNAKIATDRNSYLAAQEQLIGASHKLKSLVRTPIPALDSSSKIVQEGFITPESIDSFVKSQLEWRTKTLPQFENYAASTLAQYGRAREVHMQMYNSLVKINSDPGWISNQMWDLQNRGTKEGLPWEQYYSENPDILQRVLKEIEDAPEKARKEFEESLVQQRANTLKQLHDYFGLSFSREKLDQHNQAYYAEIPLLKEEEQHAWYEALSWLVKEFDLRMDLPKEDQMFIYRRVHDQDGVKKDVPTELPVPKLHELCLPERFAERLADTLSRNLRFEPPSTHFKGNGQELRSYCRDKAQEMAQWWNERADRLETLQR